MFIWDFVAGEVLGQIVDWFYGQVVGFLGNFFAEMGNMGAELFTMDWVQSIVLFFSYLAWALYGTGLVVACFETGVEYSSGRGNIRETALNAIKGFMAVSLFSTVPVRLYELCVSLQGTFTAALTGYGSSIGDVAGEVMQEFNAVDSLSGLTAGPLLGFGTITSGIMILFCLILMAYAVVKVFFANLKRGGILLIQIAVGSLYTPAEEDRILHNAANKNRMNKSNPNDLRQTIIAETNLQDMISMEGSRHRNKEPLFHCAVYIELTAPDYDTLKLLQTDVLTELVRSKLNIDRLLLRQQQGFCCVSPAGYNAFGAQFERVLPASSVANLYPFNYSGKTDAKGFYIGKDKYGSNILVDFDQRDEDKTSANILILGNSGQGKSYLMKLLILNLLESGKSVITLDAEHEQREMCEAVGGCFADLMAGQYIINVLEPKCWDDGGEPEDKAAPEAFRKNTLLAQHISFLKDFFRAYKDLSDAHIDTIEIMLSKLYQKWGITDRTNFRRMRPEGYPTLSDLYDLIESEYQNYNGGTHQLYTEQILREVLLGLHSMCKGADAQFFNGHTNITSSRFLVFGVKGLLGAAKNVRNAMLFNILSFLSDKLLTEGNTVAALDELYIWLSNPTAIEYIRNCLKRVRKKESAMLLASQNLEDFDQEQVREMTKPLFSIPPHQFLFNAGSIDKRSYMEMLQLDEAEYNLIKFPQRGVCLYKCGNERYLLEVHAPAYKEKLFGTAGGR